MDKKISLVEAIFITAIVSFADIFEFLVDLTGFGIILGVITNFIVGTLLQIYLQFKGIKGFWKLGTNIFGTLFDGLAAGFLPIKTITWIITLILVNKGEGILEHAGAAGKVIEKIKN